MVQVLLYTIGCTPPLIKRATPPKPLAPNGFPPRTSVHRRLYPPPLDVSPRGLALCSPPLRLTRRGAARRPE